MYYPQIFQQKIKNFGPKLLAAAFLFFNGSSMAFAAMSEYKNKDLIPSDDSGIELGSPSYAGTGCPAGTAVLILSPDKKSISMHFDQYVTEAGGSTGKTIDRKTCNLGIPIHIPAGISIAFSRANYHGYAYLPTGTEGTLHAEYFFAGSRGPQYSKTLRGEYSEDFRFSADIALTSLVWSPCGGEEILRANTSLVVKGDLASPSAIMALTGPENPEQAPLFELTWRRCH